MLNLRFHSLYEVEALVWLIKGALTDDLRNPPWRGKGDYLAGHCYVASEALFYLLGGPDSGWKPMFIRHYGTPHWFLGCNNVVIDITANQFKRPVQYGNARGKGFLTNYPSERAQIVMSRILSGEGK